MGSLYCQKTVLCFPSNFMLSVSERIISHLFSFLTSPNPFPISSLLMNCLSIHREKLYFVLPLQMPSIYLRLFFIIVTHM